MASQNELKIIISAQNLAQAELAKVSSSIKKFSDASVRASKQMAVGITAMGVAASVAIGKAVSEFSDFEKQMSMVKAITGATGKEFDDLTALAKEMGRTTAFTAKEAGDAMQFLGMAGFTTDEIMQSLEGTMNLAASAAVDLGIAADIVSNVIQGMGADVAQTDHFVDVLAKTITSSNTNLVELGEAMKFAAPISAALGQEVEQTAAALGLLANAGIKGTLAGTGLQKILMRLSSGPAKQEMKNLGVAVFDAQGNFRDLSKILRDYEKVTKDWTQEQKAASATTIAGAIGMKSWLGLLQAGSDELERYTRVLEDSEGVARQMAQTQLDNLAGSFTIMKSALSGFLIEFGSRFSPLLRTVAGQLTDFFLRVTKILPSLEDFEKFLKDNSDTIKIIAGALAGALIPAVIALTGAFATMITTLSPWMAIGAFIVANFDEIRAVAQNLGIDMQFLVGVWEMVKLKAIEIFTSVKDFFLRHRDEINTILNQMVIFFMVAWEGIKVITSEAINFFITQILPMMTEFFETIKVIVAQFQENWGGVWLEIQNILMIAWEFMKVFITEAWNIFSGVIRLGMALIRQDWDTAWKQMQSVLSAVWTLIKASTGVFFDGMEALFSAGMEVVKSVWSTSWDVMKGAIAGFFEFINKIIDAIVEKINKLGNMISSFASSASSALSSITGGGSVYKGVTAINPSALNAAVPKLAEGGIVTKPTLAMIGEGGESEAVIPLSKMGNMGGGKTIIVNVTNQGNVLTENDLTNSIMNALGAKLNLAT